MCVGRGLEELVWGTGMWGWENWEDWCVGRGDAGDTGGGWELGSCSKERFGGCWRGLDWDEMEQLGRGA